MKQICSIFLCIAISTGSALCLSPKDMTGWKVYGLNGSVKEVKYSDGTSIEFNADGNKIKEIVQVKGSTNFYEAIYQYEDATHYLLISDPYPTEITFTKESRTEMWYGTSEELSVTYRFDKQGRISEISAPNYGYGTTETFEYKDKKDPFPATIITDDYAMEGSDVATSTYVYHETDSQGNWTHCTVTTTRKVTDYDYIEDKETTVEYPAETKDIKRTITYFTDKELKEGAKYHDKTSATDDGTTSPAPAAGPQGSGPRTSEGSRDMKGTLISIMIGLLMSAHMAYVRFFRKPWYSTTYSPASFSAVREGNGRPAEATPAENSEAAALLDKAYGSFSVIGNDENGNEIRKPLKYKEINKANEYIGQAVQLAPTDPGTVDWLNALAHMVNSNMRRAFGGSFKIVLIGVAIALLLGFAVDKWLLLLYLMFSAIYILATQMPVYLIDKRKILKQQNAHDKTLNSLGEMISNAKFVRTTITWSDNTKTVHDDHSEKQAKIVVAFFISFMMGVLIPIWAILSYVRNYVLNWK